MKAIPSTETVTIGVPVYRGELFIEETLRSIQMQTHQDIEVIISLDGPQPEAEELCEPFLKDPRFRLSIQPKRLGWVGNINWLMSQVETPYWCYHQQDDLIDARYIEVLVDYARQTPQTGKVLIRLSLAAQLHVNILFLENIVGVALSRSDTRRSATLRGRDPSQRGRGFCGRRSLDGSTRTLGRTAACAERAVPKAVSRRKRDQQVVQLFRRGVCKSDHGSLRRHA